MSTTRALRMLRRVTGLLLIGVALSAHPAVAYQEADELAALLISSGLFEANKEMALKTASTAVHQALRAHLDRQLSAAEVAGLNRAIETAWADVLPDSVWQDFFARLFTEQLPREDARELLNFYKTPLGVKALALSGVLARAGNKGGEELGRRQAAAFGRRFEEEVSKQLPELKREIDSRPKRQQ